MPYKRILIGADRSDEALDAARVALRLGGDQAKYRVVRVVPPPLAVPMFPEAPENGAEREELDAWAARAGLARAERLVVTGSAGRELAHAATAFEADLVVIGHRGLGAVGRMLLGSTARALLRLSHTDTLVVRGPTPPPGEPAFKGIVVATDFFAPATRATKRAGEIQAATGARVTLAHAIDPELWRTTMATAPRDEFPDPDKWLHRHYSAELDKAAREHLGGAADTFVDHGSPAKVVTDVAARQRADLVVVGTHGAHGVQRILLGAHAESIVEHAPCSVLVVR